MIDFTSAAYLGFRHPWAALPRWDALSSGKPAALEDPAGARGVAGRLAELQGTECATLATSTLHVYWDVGGMLSADRARVLLDRGSYAIGRWGAARAAARGVPVAAFAHYDARALRREVNGRAAERRVPVVFADGFCPGCGRAAPIAEFLEILRPRRGLLVLDDTQAVGLLGGEGGGSLRLAPAGSAERVVLVTSFAKAFGAPLAGLSSTREVVRRFETSSGTRVHSSPPSVASIAALGCALDLNAARGDGLRSTLCARVRQFQRGCRDAGIRVFGGHHPVQSVAAPPTRSTADLITALRARGIIAVATRAAEAPHRRISFLLRADHTSADIDSAVAALIETVAMMSRLLPVAISRVTVVAGGRRRCRRAE